MHHKLALVNGMDFRRKAPKWGWRGFSGRFPSQAHDGGTRVGRPTAGGATRGNVGVGGIVGREDYRAESASSGRCSSAAWS